MHKKWTRPNSHKLWIYSHNKLLVGGNNLSGFKNLLGAWLWHWWALLERAWAQERPGEPSFAALSTSQQDPRPSAYLFAEAVFDTQTELRKTVAKILIKKHCGFFSYAVAWEGVGCCPSYWKICGMFATDVYQVFSLSKKEERKARLLKSKVKDLQVKPDLPNFPQHKENHPRKRSVSTKYKIFLMGQKPQPVLFKQLLCCLCPFYLDGNRFPAAEVCGMVV